MRTLALIALAPALVHAKTTVVARDADAGDHVVDHLVDDRAGTAGIIVGTPGADLTIDKVRVTIASDDLATTARIVLTISGA